MAQFDDLPPETRQMIISHLLPTRTKIEFDRINQSTPNNVIIPAALFQVNSLIRREAFDIFYRTNQISCVGRPWYWDQDPEVPKLYPRQEKCLPFPWDQHVVHLSLDISISLFSLRHYSPNWKMQHRENYSSWFKRFPSLKTFLMDIYIKLRGEDLEPRDRELLKAWLGVERIEHVTMDRLDGTFEFRPEILLAKYAGKTPVAFFQTQRGIPRMSVWQTYHKLSPDIFW